MKTGFFRVEFVLLPRFKYDSVNIILNGTKAQSNGNCKESIHLKIYRLESKLKALKIKKIHRIMSSQTIRHPDFRWHQAFGPDGRPFVLNNIALFKNGFILLI